jgi:predicted lactoylglutathione lyase
MAHISLVTLGVGDVARATAFYEQLGWRRSTASVPGVVSFLAGGTVVLAVYGADALVADAGVPATATYAMNMDTRGLVDEMLQAAHDAGAQVSAPAHETDWGGYSGHFVDADGHAWEVAHNPGFPLGDDGQVFLPGFEEDVRQQLAENDANLTEFITGADADEGRTVERLTEVVLESLRQAHDTIGAVMAQETNNVVLATMLRLSQRSRAVPSTSDDFWLMQAASTIVGSMIPNAQN